MKRARVDEETKCGSGSGSGSGSGGGLAGMALEHIFSALDFLGCGELAGVATVSKDMRATVYQYMRERRAEVEITDRGYDAAWQPTGTGALFSVAHLAGRARTLKMSSSRPGAAEAIATAVVRRNAGSLETFHCDTQPIRPSLLVTLAACTNIQQLTLGSLDRTGGEETALTLLLTRGLGERLRVLRIGELPPRLASHLLERGGLPVLEELHAYLDNWSLLRQHSASLRSLYVPARGGTTRIHRPRDFARGVAALQQLRTLCIDANLRDTTSVRQALPELSWTLPHLVCLRCPNISLCELPPLRADQLVEADLWVSSDTLAELLEACPVVERIGNREHFTQLHVDSGGWDSRQVDAGAMASIAESIAGFQQGQAQVRQLVLLEPPLGAPAVVALSRHWLQLETLYITLPQNAPPRATRLLLEALPLLCDVALVRMETREGDAEELAFDLPASPATAPEAEPEAVVRPRLRKLHTAFADDTTFVHLELPGLHRMTLTGTACRNIGRALASAPAVVELKIERSTGDASTVERSAYRAARCASLFLTSTMYTATDLQWLLLMLPELQELRIEGCDYLEPSAVLTLVVGLSASLPRLERIARLSEPDDPNMVSVPRREIRRLADSMWRLCPQIRRVDLDGMTVSRADELAAN